MKNAQTRMRSHTRSRSMSRRLPASCWSSGAVACRWVVRGRNPGAGSIQLSPSRQTNVSGWISPLEEAAHFREPHGTAGLPGLIDEMVAVVHGTQVGRWRRS